VDVDVIIRELKLVSFRADIEPDAFADASSAEITQISIATEAE